MADDYAALVAELRRVADYWAKAQISRDDVDVMRRAAKVIEDLAEKADTYQRLYYEDRSVREVRLASEKNAALARLAAVEAAIQDDAGQLVEVFGIWYVPCHLIRDAAMGASDG